MSRLLFAAARGARVQRQQEDMRGRAWWADVNVQWGLDDELRIHPDDAHLQYGPISTALRDESRYELVLADIFPVIRYGVFWLRTDDHALYSMADQLQRSLALLILAEALADDGL